MRGFEAKGGETRGQVTARAFEHLERSVWAKGVVLGNHVVGGTTQGNLRAGARKLADVAMARRRRTEARG